MCCEAPASVNDNRLVQCQRPGIPERFTLLCLAQALLFLQDRPQGQLGPRIDLHFFQVLLEEEQQHGAVLDAWINSLPNATGTAASQVDARGRHAS